jgi:octaprenyl-diphosphate synthase
MQLAKKVISSELIYFEEYFTGYLKSEVPLLNNIFNYIVKRKGKQIRPMLSLLCARMGGQLNEKSYCAALLVEILHTASLIHDDIVDESMERRGAFSINALWNNKIGVLVGDNLSFKALLLVLSNKDHRILEIYTSAIQQIIEGEILQLQKSRRLNLGEDVYYEIIGAKTAAFFAAASASGASSTFEDNVLIEKLHQFGKNAGIAFQLKDDLFDYSNADVGKPTDNDIKDNKLTLPLIYTLNNCRPGLKRKLIHIIKRKNKNKEKVKYVVEEVIKAGGIKYAEEKMFYYRDEALKLLHEFPESEVRDALEELVRYTTDRTY